MQTSEVVAQPQRNAAKPPAILLMPTPTPTSSTDHSTADLVVDTHHQPLAAVVKRKQRTKRPRHHRDPPAAASSSASSSESTTTEEEDMAHCLILLAQGAAGGSPHASVVDSKPSPSPSPSPSMSSSPQHHQNQQAPQPPVPAPAPPRAERYTSRKYTEAATTADGVRAGFYVYECKTCNKCFPTFQALGGHRASHKKPRLADDVAAAALPVNVVTTTTATETKKQHKPPTTAPSPSPPPPLPALPLQLHPPHLQTIDIAAAFPDVTTALSLNSVAAAAAVRSGGAKLRVHECSTCGAEFASGQALGGHMRRHRPLNAPDRAVTTAIAAGITSNSKSKEEASVGINLELDLNLPAPSDEEAAVSLIPPPPPPAVMLGLGQFNDGKKAGLMLTASALVDCHY